MRKREPMEGNDSYTWPQSQWKGITVTHGLNANGRESQLHMALEPMEGNHSYTWP